MEALTVKTLRAEGFSILGRNRKICGVEIDVIARKINKGEEHYFFVECKFRRSADGFPLVSAKQKERYRKAAALWQSELGHFVNVHMTIATKTSDDTVIQILPDYF